MLLSVHILHPHLRRAARPCFAQHYRTDASDQAFLRNGGGFVFGHDFVQSARRQAHQRQRKEPHGYCRQPSVQIAAEHGGKGRLKQVARQSVHGKEHHHQHQHRHATDIQPTQKPYEHARVRRVQPDFGVRGFGQAVGQQVVQPVADAARQHGDDFQHAEQNHQRDGDAEDFRFGGVD